MSADVNAAAPKIEAQATSQYDAETIRNRFHELRKQRKAIQEEEKFLRAALAKLSHLKSAAQKLTPAELQALADDLTAAAAVAAE